MVYEYTNQELAKHYLAVMSVHVVNIKRTTYPRIGRIISGQDHEIVEHYQQEGNLDRLTIPGIGSGTKAVLELILEEGVEQAVKITIEDRERELRQGQGTQIVTGRGRRDSLRKRADAYETSPLNDQESFKKDR